MKTDRAQLASIFITIALGMTACEKIEYFPAITDPSSSEWISDSSKKTLDRLSGTAAYGSIISKQSSQNIPDSYNTGIPIGGRLYNSAYPGSYHLNPWGLLYIPIDDYLDGKNNWQWELYVPQMQGFEEFRIAPRGFSCTADNKNCMLALHKNGLEEVVWYEYQPQNGFVYDNSFAISSGLADIAWKDKDNIFFSHNNFHFGLTSTFPRHIYHWKRGDSVDDTKVVYAANESSLSVTPYPISIDNKNEILAIEYRDRYISEYTILANTSNPQIKLDIPNTLILMGQTATQLIFRAKQTVQYKDNEVQAGCLSAVLKSGLSKNNFELTSLYCPSKKGLLKDEDILVQDNSILINEYKNGRYTLKLLGTNGQLKEEKEFDKNQTISVIEISEEHNLIITEETGFLNPGNIHLLDLTFKTISSRIIPRDLAEENYIIKRLQATSKDDTLVNYTVLHHKDLKLNRENPAWIYTYGGFENLSTPLYSELVRKHWIDKGGIYVIAHVRGDGEQGVNWHNQAIKENKYKTLDDLDSVTKDLVNRGYSQHKKIAIQGASNGGLTVSAAMIRKPHLYGAMISENGLSNMLDYHTMDQGTAWLGEYGDPKIPQERKYLREISPLHNIQKGVTYPPSLILNNKNDNRVSPEHSQQFARTLESAGQRVDYYEFGSGGHLGGNHEDSQLRDALILSFLHREILTPESE